MFYLASIPPTRMPNPAPDGAGQKLRQTETRALPFRSIRECASLEVLGDRFARNSRRSSGAIHQGMKHIEPAIAPQSAHPMRST